MLKGISPRLSSPMLTLLNDMGHGDQLILADAHFPARSTHHNVIHCADSIGGILEAILPLLVLDEYVETAVFMMAPAQRDHHDSNDKLEAYYKQILAKHEQKDHSIQFIERFDFYEMSKKSYGIILSSDTQKYANIILTKGVTP